MKSKKRSFTVHNKLKLIVFLDLIRIVVTIPIVFYDIFTKVLSVPFAAVGLAIGFIIGTILLKTYKFSWDKDSNKITSRMEKFGFIVMVLYALFIFFRSRLIGIFVQGAVVAAIGFSITVGIAIARIYSTRKKILRTLKDHDPYFHL